MDEQAIGTGKDMNFIVSPIHKIQSLCCPYGNSSINKMFHNNSMPRFDCNMMFKTADLGIEHENSVIVRSNKNLPVCIYGSMEITFWHPLFWREIADLSIRADNIQEAVFRTYPQVSDSILTHGPHGATMQCFITIICQIAEEAEFCLLKHVDSTVIGAIPIAPITVAHHTSEIIIGQ